MVTCVASRKGLVFYLVNDFLRYALNQKTHHDLFLEDGIGLHSAPCLSAGGSRA